jgi:hypothetical protein
MFLGTYLLFVLERTQAANNAPIGNLFPLIASGANSEGGEIMTLFIDHVAPYITSFVSTYVETDNSTRILLFQRSAEAEKKIPA